MTTPDDPEDPKKFDMGKMARAGAEPPTEPPASREIIEAGTQKDSDIDPQLPVKSTQNILETSDNAWLAGTRVLQGNLIQQLQEAKSSLLEGLLIGAKRRQVIREVTEQYVRFLSEEAKMTSEAALQARRSYLQRELKSIKGEINRELADMTGQSIIDIEAIFHEHVSQIQTEELRNAYARFVMDKIFDLMDMQLPK